MWKRWREFREVVKFNPGGAVGDSRQGATSWTPERAHAARSMRRSHQGTTRKMTVEAMYAISETGSGGALPFLTKNGSRERSPHFSGIGEMGSNGRERQCSSQRAFADRQYPEPVAYSGVKRL